MSPIGRDVPPTRIRVVSDREVRADGAYVLYWMTAARRTRWNFALERAIGWATELGKPLVVLEALRVDYPWASDRLHAFVLDGMRDNAAALAAAGAHHYAYVERHAGEGKGLVEALAADACVVVTDHAPFFFLGRMLASVAPRLSVRVEATDGNGLVPLTAITQRFTFAHPFRRFVQKTVRPHLALFPIAEPLSGVRLARIGSLACETRWPRLAATQLEDPRSLIASLPIDHRVPPVEDRGGSTEARARLDAFVRYGLGGYAEARNHPDERGTSRLSSHLHFGHVSTHQIFATLAERADWSIEKLGTKAHGRREEFWNVSDAADAFLDELVIWRELGLARAALGPETIAWDDLPPFARATLEKHASDRRAYVYDAQTLEQSRTHDPIWNATMHQLREEGRIHGYLRILWGKKILEWSAHPRDALEAMVALNDRWSVDGRDPSSYTNIGWVLGMYDRPWAPERSVFGTVRYMSSDAAVKKLRMREWLARWGESAAQRTLAIE